MAPTEDVSKENEVTNAKNINPYINDVIFTY